MNSEHARGRPCRRGPSGPGPRKFFAGALLLTACQPAPATLVWPGDAQARFVVRMDTNLRIISIDGPIDPTRRFVAPIPTEGQTFLLNVHLERTGVLSPRIDLDAADRVRIEPRSEAVAGCQEKGYLAEDYLELPMASEVASSVVEAFRYEPPEGAWIPRPLSSLGVNADISLRIPLRETCEPGFSVDLRPFGATSPYFDLSAASIQIAGSERPIGAGDVVFQQAHPIDPDHLVLISGWNMLIVERGQPWRDLPGRAVSFGNDVQRFFPGTPAGISYFGEGLAYWPELRTGVAVFTGFDARERQIGSTAWSSFSVVEGELALEPGHRNIRRAPEGPYSFADIAADEDGEYVAVGQGNVQTATAGSANPVVLESLPGNFSRVEWVPGFVDGFVLSGDTGVHRGRPATGVGGLQPLSERFELNRIHSISAEMNRGVLEVYAGSADGRIFEYRMNTWAPLEFELPEEARTCAPTVCGRRIATASTVSVVRVVGDDAGRRRLLFIHEKCAAVFAVDLEARCVVGTPLVAAAGNAGAISINGLEWDIDNMIPLGDSTLLLGAPAILEELRLIAN